MSDKKHNEPEPKNDAAVSLRDLDGQFQSFVIETGNNFREVKQSLAELREVQPAAADVNVAAVPVRVRLALLEAATLVYNAIPVKSSDPLTDYRRAALAAIALLAAVDAET